jgi:hypothetical protein
MSPSPKRPSEAYRSATLFKDGIGHVVIARFKSSGEAEVGVFLVDVHCLGVKNAFFTRLWGAQYEKSLLAKVFPNGEGTPLSPACARKLVEGAVTYASALGLPPHEDYRLACRVLGGIKAEDCTESFTYGRDGKPFYIQGRNDSDRLAAHIVKQLHERCGEGNYHFLVVADGPDDDRFPGARTIEIPPAT